MFGRIRRDRARYAIARARAREVAFSKGLDSEMACDRIRAPLENAYRNYAEQNGGASYAGIFPLPIILASGALGIFAGYLAGNSAVGGFAGAGIGVVIGNAVYEVVEGIGCVDSLIREKIKSKPASPFRRRSVEEFLNARKRSSVSCLDAKLSGRESAF